MNQSRIRSSKIPSPFHNLACPYCGQKMSRYGNPNAPNFATLDHIVPQCQGGTETIRVCRACNLDKMHLSLSEWRIVLIWRKRRAVIFHYEWVALRYLWQLAILEASKIPLFC